MRPESLLEHLNAEPFKPFRIHMTDGKTFDLTHPDQAIVTMDKVLIGVNPRPPGVFHHAEHCALIHIARIEELQAA